MKPVRLSGHAGTNMRHRGTTEQEVIDVIRTANWEATEQGRWSVEKTSNLDGIGTEILRYKAGPSYLR